MTQFMKDEDDDALAYSCQGYDEKVLSYLSMANAYIHYVGVWNNLCDCGRMTAEGKECSITFDILVKDKGNLVEAILILSEISYM